MPAEEITFRVAFDGPLTDFTRREPAASVSLWCDWKREVVEISGASTGGVSTLRDDLSRTSTWMEAFEIDGGGHVLVLDCLGLPHDFVNEAVDAARCLSLPPTRFQEGWEHYKVVSFGEERSRAIFRSIRDAGGEVELLTKKPLKVQPLMNTRDLGVGAILDGLTDRQLEAIRLAHKHGYYTTPRRTNAASIADAVGISRSTFDEHLRKAENKLVGNLVPYVELWARQRTLQPTPPHPPRPPRVDPADVLMARARDAAEARRKARPN